MRAISKHLYITTWLLTAILSLTGPIAGCRKPEATTTAAPRPWVVTYSPALTSLVFDMSLGDHVVGVTSYCELPAGQSRTVVGNALSVRVEPILAVEPDILMVQMELKHFEPIHKLRPSMQIEHFTIETLADIPAAMERIGGLLNNPDRAARASDAFRALLEETRQRPAKLPKLRTIFVMGYESPAAAGAGTFMTEMIDIAGGENILAARYKGWFKPGLETIIDLAPEIIICQTTTDKQADARKYWETLGDKTGWQKRVIIITDADWTYPGTHLADRIAQLAEMLHPPADGAHQ